MEETLNAARSFVFSSDGWQKSVVPTRGKVPVVPWREYQERYPTEEELKEWFENTNNNIAVVTGSISNLIVLDIDDPNFDYSTIELPPTRIVNSGGGGKHFYFKYPFGKEIKNVPQGELIEGQKIELKAEGGLITVPPSIHPNGNQYKYDINNPLYDFKIADAPEWLIKKAEEEAGKSNDYGELFRGVSAGRRNEASAIVAGKILRGLKTEDFENVGWGLLEAWNTKNQPPLSERELRQTFQSIAELEISSRDKLVFPAKNPINSDEEKKRVVLSANELLQMQEKEQPFLIEGMIVEGSINALTSDSGKGKSLVMLKMAESVARGVDFLEKYKTKKAKVLILDLEMSENDVIQRVKSIIQGEIEGLDFYHCQTFDIEDESDFTWLLEEIKTKGYGLIVFDTLSTIHLRNENDNSEMRLVNKKLLELVNNFGVTVLYVHHHRKPAKGEQHSQASSRGASEIISKAASHLLLDSNNITILEEKIVLPGLNVTLEQHKARQIKKLERFAVNVHYSPTTKKTVFQWVGLEQGKVNAVAKAKSLVVSFIEEDREYTIAEITENVKVAGVSNIRNAMKELVSEGILVARYPHPLEKTINGKPIKTNTKIYSVNKNDDNSS